MAFKPFSGAGDRTLRNHALGGEATCLRKKIQDKLVGYIRDAHSMERNVLQMLTSMISTTNDAQIREALELHRRETEGQIDRLAERLKAHGESTSTVKDVGAVVGAMTKGVGDAVRGDKAAKNARDGFVTENMEIAAYELLERLATRAGDEVTAEVARSNKAEEEAMRDIIASNWDRTVDLMLAEEEVMT